MTAWTHQHMQGRPGICVPETMRFNGPGIEYEGWDPAKPIVGLNCDAASKPYYNARTISTGAEVSSWIWQQYLQTRDRAFLETNYPVMTAASRFLLDYEKKGQDGQMHTSPSNAHETQWDTTDPTTDLAARQTLFTATQEAAELLHRGRIAGKRTGRGTESHSAFSPHARVRNAKTVAAERRRGIAGRYCQFL